MKISQTANVLTKIAAYDRRTLGEADVEAWHDVIGELDYADAMESVKRWYSDQGEWMMPVHVRRIVREIQAEREAAARATGWAPGQAGVPKDEAAPEVPRGGRMALSDLPAAVADLIARVRADLPEGDPEALYPRRAAWEREHAAYLRTQNAQPNPLYKPKATETMAPGSCGHPGHPVTSHLCMSGGVPFSAEHYKVDE